jgi:hypothetical protein
MLGRRYGDDMPATLLQKRRYDLADDRFVDLSIWKLPGSAHQFKYRLALVVDGPRVLRYDNEAGKGDHKHLGESEVPYRFTSLDRLVDDFWADVSRL